jgi:hypothetical protein
MTAGKGNTFAAQPLTMATTIDNTVTNLHYIFKLASGVNNLQVLTGAYNAWLIALFPAEEGFFTEIDYKPLKPKKGEPPTIVYRIFWRKIEEGVSVFRKPILSVDIHHSLLDVDDDVIRRRLVHKMQEELATMRRSEGATIVFGVSAFGNNFATFSSGDSPTDDPADNPWKYDGTTIEGVKHFVEFAKQIRGTCHVGV